jgi:hypothetical protein
MFDSNVKTTKQKINKKNKSQLKNKPMGEKHTMSEERETSFPPESRRRLDDAIRPIVQQLLGRKGRAGPVGHHRNMRWPYLLQFLSLIWGDSSGRSWLGLGVRVFRHLGKRGRRKTTCSVFKFSSFLNN